ncbi:MAG: putative endonuclease [Phormidesmis priestleyi Ana]|uniref:Putative endonuclease n=1 Tax=Phormidesmis priestleyi Ana TaxID=1666911 RepID=A0A0P8A141_9CYAN|nr:MAG: putative endonuclease [Phormidesmis priestleyi Ana]
MAASSWFVYLIRTRHNTLYTGITTDVAQRLQAHTNGRQGAKYLRAKGPLSLVYQVELGNRSLAAKAEYHIKKLTKSRKEEIITNQLNSQDLLTLLNIQTTES